MTSWYSAPRARRFLLILPKKHVRHQNQHRHLWEREIDAQERGETSDEEEEGEETDDEGYFSPR